MTEAADTDALDVPFSDDETDILATIAGLIIPASEEFGVPGADDPTIVADMVRSAAPHQAALREALSLFAGLEAQSAEQRSQDFRNRHPAAAELLQTLVVQCYYRDERVMRALGLEPRPPFPRGFALEAGDWSLLDPVRARPPLYRTVR